MTHQPVPPIFLLHVDNTTIAMGNRTNRNAKLYANTMAFTIISGIVSLMLLLLLKYGSGASVYTPLILTVEIGLVVVIVVSIMRVMQVERKNKKLAKNNLDNLLAVNTCPDYWTLAESSTGTKQCTRVYKVPDAETTIKMIGTQDAIQLADYHKQPLGAACRKASALKAPWTDVRAVCDAFNVAASPSP